MEGVSSEQVEKPKRSSIWILWVILGIGVVLLGGCSLMFAGLTQVGSGASALTVKEQKKLQEEVYYKEDGAEGKVAVVFIEGVITGQGSTYQESMAEQAIAQIKQATEDQSIKGLLLYLNTPGGEVTASDKIYHACEEFKKSGRPIVAYMDTVAASGGYYIACAADEVVANETTITGSIGVIIGGVNAKGLMDKVGLKSQTFTSGAYKDTLSMSREMREDERVYIQSLVDEMYEKFAGIVSKAREIPLDELRDGIADGRIFNGSAALQVGLVDQNGYLEDAISALRQRAELSAVRVVRYRSEPGIGDLLGALGVRAQSESEIKIDWGQGEFTQNLKPFVPYVILPGY